MKCALCDKETDLKQSHIIPKLVYRRIRSNKKSRFRSLDDFTKVLQDGEKRPMLCHECEELFSSYEVKFVSNFLDDYLKTDKLKKTQLGVINNYFLTVAWRVLWDDLYRLNSYVNSFTRDIFEEFCSELKQYLLSIGKGNACQPPSKFTTHVYKLDKLIKNDSIIQFSSGCLFGYSFYSTKTTSAYIIVYYAGLIFVTEYKYDKRKYIILGAKPILFKRLAQKKEITEEIKLQFSKMALQYKSVMTPEMQHKIEKYYKTH